jgi:dTDP-4-dehydrorhamnose reductase
MADVLVLGATGMLGHVVSATLESDLEVITTARNGEGQLRFDCEVDDIAACIEKAGNPPYIVNAIGVIKPHIDESSPTSRQRTIEINSLFPHRLAEAAAQAGSHVIQIATDCVYSGTVGRYSEVAPHDPWDVYGKTKSLGEAPHQNFSNLRCSIIGPERGRSTSLWEWVLEQPRNATITGYTNHLWNGITTHAFARICAGIIQTDWRQAGTFHLIPADVTTKAELVTSIARHNNRPDITIEDGVGASPIDRTISTLNPELNAQLWTLGGYVDCPTIDSLVAETAEVAHLE